MNRRAEAQALFAQGLAKNQIARMLGVSYATILRYVDAEYDERVKRQSREAKQRRVRPCATPGCLRLAKYSGHRGKDGEYLSRLCEPCKQAEQSAAALRRNPHGTRASYARGCRCADCRAGNARYARDWYRRHRRVAA